MNSVEEAKCRCISLRDQTLASLPSSKISPSSKLTLNRVLSAELRFLSRLSSSVNTSSLNLGYLESILRAILHPSVHRVSRLCKPVHGCHVDVVCTFARFPAWLLVSDRNPNYIKATDLQSRVRRILAAARSAVALKPSLVFLLFSKGVADDVAGELSQEFGAVEVAFFGFGRAFEIEISGGDVGVLRGLVEVVEGKGVARGGDGDGDGNGFGSLVSSMRPDGDQTTVGVVNFDTTALIAMVSGISNGGCERLLKAPRDEMMARFKSNYEFVIAQVMSELEAPILVELGGVISGKKGIICASVHSEFKELVLMCGGPNEKSRANLLIKHLLYDMLTCCKFSKDMCVRQVPDTTLLPDTIQLHEVSVLRSQVEVLAEMEFEHYGEFSKSWEKEIKFVLVLELDSRSFKVKFWSES